MAGISLEELLFQYFNEAFPILPGSSPREPEQALQQFYRENIGVIQTVRDPLPEWSQGDILEPIPFVDWSEEGEPVFFEAPGMIMNSTCDLDRKENIVLCPCLILNDLNELSAYNDISKNIVFDFLFLGKCLTGDEWVVDLSHPMTLPRKRTIAKIQEESISRKHSLTDKGWYLLITKFAMKYLRSDDRETMVQR
jgi:hypothetical protein